MPRAAKPETRDPNEPTTKNVCIPVDDHHARLLKMGGFDINKVPTWTVDIIDPDCDNDVIESIKSYVFDDVTLAKFDSMGWQVTEKRPTSMKGVFAGVICLKPPVIRGRAARASRNIDKLRKDYLLFCEEFVTKQAAEMRKQLSAATRNLTSASAALVQAQRNKDYLEKIVNGIGKNEQEHRKKYLDDFESILKIEKVTGVNVVGCNLEVFTDTLYCLHEWTGVEYEIGKFRFTFDVKNAEVKFFNLTRKVEGNDPKMNAPHVYENGGACLGSANRPFNELFARHDYYGLVCLAIQFIESANLNDIGEFLENWPVSKRSKKAKAKARSTVLTVDKKTGKMAVKKKVIEAEAENEAAVENV